MSRSRIRSMLGTSRKARFEMLEDRRLLSSIFLSDGGQLDGQPVNDDPTSQVIYETDFSSDPGWITNNPSHYYWDPAEEAYYMYTRQAARVNGEYEHTKIEVPYSGGSFQLEYDVKPIHVSWASHIELGLNGEDMREDEPHIRTGWELTSAKLTKLQYRNASGGHDTSVIHNPNAWTLNEWYHGTLIYDELTSTISFTTYRRSDGANPTTHVSENVGDFPSSMNWLGCGLHAYYPYSSAYAEAYYDNVVLSVPMCQLPDIEMVRATTEDSQSVTFDYVVEGSAIDELEFAVYRSEDAVFDPVEDLPRLATDVTYDVNPGAYTGEIGVELNIDPTRPYVFVVADPDNLIEETEEGNNDAFFRKYVIGAVTHGFQPCGTLHALPEWVNDIAQGLRDAGYDFAGGFDWTAFSNLPVPRQAIHGGESLALGLIDTAHSLNLPAGSVLDVHLIGHSRGAIVIGEALNTLLEHTSELPEALERGYMKMTMLDPHPARNYENVEWYSRKPGLLGWFAEEVVRGFQEAAQDPQVAVPQNADEAEGYYQNTDWSDISKEVNWKERILNLWGEHPIGNASMIDKTAPNRGHSEIVEWYQEHVINPALPASTQVAGNAVATRVASENAVPGQRVSDMDLLYPELVENRGVANSMLSQLDAAMDAYERGNFEATTGILGAFVNHVEAQRGKHIVPEAADYFAGMANLMIEMLEQDTTAMSTLAGYSLAVFGQADAGENDDQPTDLLAPALIDLAMMEM